MQAINTYDLYLIKEDPKLIIEKIEETGKSNSKIMIENTNNFLLILTNFEVGDFQPIEYKNNEHLKVDLKTTFDPYRYVFFRIVQNSYDNLNIKIFNFKSVCENSVDLNINLMKWRMAPDLNIDIIKNTKFLLIGAGTLGCHVSRNLIGWGARNINFIDNGYISYSNPVRQSLYTFSDAKEGPNLKAETAAKKLKEIFPAVKSEGFSFQIPLPGRKLVDLQAQENYFMKVDKLENLIKESDVVFLLTDSRESRWFPTVFTKKYNKICITAAIGFDSFVVMRHGRDIKTEQSAGNEEKVGCYFCNDIVSPVDTSMNRTLDQQCTISRPGISGICSGFAAELGISMLQKGNGIDDDIPEIIRGNIRDFNFLKIKLEASRKYKKLLKITLLKNNFL